MEAAGAARRPLQVVYKAPASLTPDPRNARTHPKRQIEQIAQSIRAFGFTNPILADPHGNLIAGHGRLRAAREMGLSEVPVIELARALPSVAVGEAVTVLSDDPAAEPDLRAWCRMRGQSYEGRDGDAFTVRRLS